MAIRMLTVTFLSSVALGGVFLVSVPEPIVPIEQHVVHNQERVRPAVSVLFVGDMMFDRTVRTFGTNNGWDTVFRCTAETLRSFDAVVGNMEGPVTTHASISVGKMPGERGNTQFTFPIDIPSILSSYNVQAVSLANNHIRDFGKDGVAQTRSFLEAASIRYVGDPADSSTLSTRVVIAPLSFVLVGFNQFLGGDPKETVAEIKKYPPDDHVVVFAHWGDEYVGVNEFQKTWARAFIDAGADAVIGAHPHVVQEVEYYKGKIIAYSLGNFIFDQYWNDAVSNGLGIALTFAPDQIMGVEYLTFSRNKTPEPCVSWRSGLVPISLPSSVL